MDTGRPRLLSNADLGRARSMRHSGASIRQVAKAMGVSYHTMRRRFVKPYKQAERRW